ncbi:hypothetical protein ATY76_25615 [Rhizobium sp. R339]|uniref:hypothetical protein n=1 Tax=Rhizobium sp. R339 TaxID=1764273 RepID=UPI000B529508|nr:hypothetical protein [Rhizobium sp. R339]OWV75178.1 hypothetical protein ATY76_25615 [Rhizobium sp. R339]
MTPDLSGFNPFKTIKFGSGVLGKTAPVMIAFITLVGIAVYKLPANFPYAVIGLVALAAAVVMIYCFKAFGYAERHPGPSVLEGAQLVKYRLNEIAASDPKIIDHSPDGAQGTLPPSQLRIGGEDRNV